MVDTPDTEVVAPPSVSEAVESAETVEATYFETIQRLAALPIHEYEQCRKEEAKRLKMRASVLDKDSEVRAPP